MSPLNTNDLHRIFEKLDQNGDGLVSLDELKWLLERIGMSSSPDELESLVGKTSLDLLDFFFFYDTVIKQKIGDHHRGEVLGEEEDDSLGWDLAETFKVYDLNGDGFISSGEVESVLLRLGLWKEHSLGPDGKRMIDKYDTNSDGVLDFEEFKNMMLLSNS